MSPTYLVFVDEVGVMRPEMWEVLKIGGENMGENRGNVVFLTKTVGMVYFPRRRIKDLGSNMPEYRGFNPNGICRNFNSFSSKTGVNDD